MADDHPAAQAPSSYLPDTSSRQERLQDCRGPLAALVMMEKEIVQGSGQASDAQVMREKKVGVVAHFYMDPEVQGVLSQASERWPHINISDSLAMADKAVKMAEQGCKAIAVLGVDFMSENVRAILDEAGHQDVKVCSGSSFSSSFTYSCRRSVCFLTLGASDTQIVPLVLSCSSSPEPGIFLAQHGCSAAVCHCLLLATDT